LDRTESDVVNYGSGGGGGKGLNIVCMVNFAAW